MQPPQCRSRRRLLHRTHTTGTPLPVCLSLCASALDVSVHAEDVLARSQDSTGKAAFRDLGVHSCHQTNGFGAVPLEFCLVHDNLGR